jgi:O-acetylhomoserine (thiol)-lyase
MPTDSKNAETIVLHGGSYRADPATNAVAVPIYQTTSYQFNSTEHAGNLFALKELGNIYTRIMNPTSDVFEKRVAELEGGIAALAVASGQAATTLSVLNLAGAGDNLVSSQTLYGGTYNLFAYTLPKWGVTTRFVDIHNLDQVRAAIDGGTRLLFVETIGNPRIDVLDIAAVGAIAREAGIKVAMTDAHGVH